MQKMESERGQVQGGVWESILKPGVAVSQWRVLRNLVVLYENVTGGPRF